jgi:Tol biopolymer transport system component
VLRTFLVWNTVLRTHRRSVVRRSNGIALLASLSMTAGCNDGPTLAGGTGGGGQGSLIVNRVEHLPGARARRMSVDPLSGASRSQVTWLPDAVERQWGIPFGNPISFSRDGRWMAWIETVRDTLRYGTCPFEVCPSDDARNLYVARVGTSARTLLTPQYHFDRAPSFSPDGKQLVLIREYFNGREETITLALDGEDITTVLPRTDRRRGAPAWSPTGDVIAYVAPDVGALHLVDADGSNPRAITPESYVVGLPAWSPDGSRIAVVVWNRTGEFDEEYAVAVIRPDGSQVTLLPFAAGGYRLQKLWWSPDGTRIAYCTDAPGSAGRTVVRVATVATGEVRVITPAGYSDCNPIWRP